MKAYERLKTCKAIVCDLDGTLYLDQKPFEFSFEFLQSVLESNKTLFYFTNNSSKSRQSYLNKLKEIGFPAHDGYLVTSADCAISYLKQHRLFPEIYLVSTRDLQNDFTAHGFRLLSNQEVTTDPLPKAVVLTFDTELTYEKIHTCYDLIIKDLPYIATHADLLCPVSKNIFKPDVGSFISLFQTATGGKTPIVVGKPTAEAVNAICERANAKPEEIAFIGDRLYTDIRMAEQSNMLAVLVLSGETTKEMLAVSRDQPDLVVDNVKELIPYL
jgi:HAD superfamily hydrolase (TIGR01450 family)